MSIMKRIMLLGALVVFLSLFTPLKVLASPPDGGCDPLDPACPIDGGITLLIAAGIGLGAKRALKKSNED